MIKENPTIDYKNSSSNDDGVHNLINVLLDLTNKYHQMNKILSKFIHYTSRAQSYYLFTKKI